VSGGEAQQSVSPQDVAIRGETIRLGQLLKLAGLAQSGSEAKELLARESVSVNGERETRRGRQLHPGDTVVVGEQRLRIAGGDA
jgi:ribosome-associated protein